MGVFSVDLDKINLDDDKNFDKDHPETAVHFRLLAWSNKFEKRKALKKRYKERINASSMAFYEIRKRNRINFYWESW